MFSFCAGTIGLGEDLTPDQALERDRRNLARDWDAVGQDMRRALDRARYGGPKA